MTDPFWAATGMVLALVLAVLLLVPAPPPEDPDEWFT